MPDIRLLNYLLVALRDCFTQNISFIKYLLLCPETPIINNTINPDIRLACFKKCWAMHHCKDAKHLL
jgi:hypothetical protein